MLQKTEITNRRQRSFQLFFIIFWVICAMHQAQTEAQHPAIVIVGHNELSLSNACVCASVCVCMCVLATLDIFLLHLFWVTICTTPKREKEQDLVPRQMALTKNNHRLQRMQPEIAIVNVVRSGVVVVLLVVVQWCLVCCWFICSSILNAWLAILMPSLKCLLSFLHFQLHLLFFVTIKTKKENRETLNV